jgi:hypothetical protein
MQKNIQGKNSFGLLSPTKNDDPPTRPPESFFVDYLQPILTQQTSLLRLFSIYFIKKFSRKTKEQVHLSSREALAHVWFDGVEMISGSLWSLAFLGMWGYDSYNFWQNPNNHYQMNLWKNLIAGLPENYDYQNSALSSNLGGDIASIHRFEYWPWTIVLASAMFTGFLFRCLAQVENSLSINPNEKKLKRSLFQKIWQDGVCSLPYLSFPYWLLYRSKLIVMRIDYDTLRNELSSIDRSSYKLESEPTSPDMKQGSGKDNDTDSPLRDGQVDIPRDLSLSNLSDISDLSPEMLNQWENILNSISDRSYFVKVAAVDQLAQIAYWRRQDEMGDEAFLELKKAAEKSGYALYKLWAIGRADSVLLYMAGYLLVVPVQVYSKLRLWALIVTKIMGLVEFLINQRQCTQSQSVWTYAAVIGNYVCLPCGLEYTAYKPEMKGEDCLNGLTSQPRSFAQLMQNLEELQYHGPFSQIDLHLQTWTDWEKNEWQQFLSFLNRTIFAQTPVFNLSRSVPGDLAVEPDFLALLADYLPDSKVEKFDLSRQIIRPQGMQALIPGFRNNSRLIYVGLAECQLNDAVFDPWIDLLPGMTTLSSLNVSNNQLSGLALSRLAQVWNNNFSLISLDFSNNLLESADLNQFPVNTLTSLRILDISKNVFGIGALNNFCDALSNSSLTRLNMNYCRLTGPRAAELFSCIASSNISYLGWAGNEIGYAGFETIAELLPVSRVGYFDLGDNEIDDDALALLSPALSAPNNSLTDLELSGNPFTGAGFITFASALNHSSLRGLGVSGITSLGNDTVTAITSIPAEQFGLTNLNLRNTGLSSSGAAELLLYLARTSLTDLDISRNLLLGNMSLALMAAFNSSLKRLNLHETYISETDMQAALSILRNSDSPLEYVDFGENDFGDLVAIAFAEQLLQPVPNQEKYLRTLTSDIDFGRAANRSSTGTHIKQIRWEDDNRLTELGATALCRFWPFTGNDNFDLTLSGVNLDPLLSSVKSCPYSTSKILLTQSDSKSLASRGAMPSELLTMGVIMLSMLPHWRLFNASLIASLGCVFGAPGIILGAGISYQAKTIFTSVGKKFGFFSSDNKPSTTGSKIQQFPQLLKTR